MKQFSLVFIIWLKLQTILWFEIRNVEGILGGELARHGQFKYMVSVQADGEHIGGGTIVDKAHVVTAAHCFFDENGEFMNKKYTVLAQTINLMLDIVAGIELTVTAIYISKDYIHVKREPGVFFYAEIGDIAVLELEGELPLGEHVKAINFPKRVNGKLPQYTTFKSTLIGYGLNVNPFQTSNYISEIVGDSKLRFAETTIQSRSSYKNKISIPITKHMLVSAVNPVISFSPQGACVGDDGSPLVYEGMLVGVLAQYWRDCNEMGVGSIYTRVTEYLQCIQDIINNNEVDCMVKYKKVISSNGQIKWNVD